MFENLMLYFSWYALQPWQRKTNCNRIFYRPILSQTCTFQFLEVFTLSDFSHPAFAGVKICFTIFFSHTVTIIPHKKWGLVLGITLKDYRAIILCEERTHVWTSLVYLCQEHSSRLRFRYSGYRWCEMCNWPSIKTRCDLG